MKKLSYIDEKNYFISNYLQRGDDLSLENKKRKLILVHCDHLDFIVEEAPHYPGLAYAEDTFMRIFSDYTRPKRILVRINDTNYTFT